VRLGDVARFKDMCDFTSNSYIKGWYYNRSIPQVRMRFTWITLCLQKANHVKYLERISLPEFTWMSNFSEEVDFNWRLCPACFFVQKCKNECSWHTTPVCCRSNDCVARWKASKHQ
jgi:hypothetical protein